MKSSITPPFELIELSARIGHDIDLVQGAGGNSSAKEGGVLWVKASGTWLAAARDHQSRRRCSAARRRTTSGPRSRPACTRCCPIVSSSMSIRST